MRYITHYCRNDLEPGNRPYKGPRTTGVHCLASPVSKQYTNGRLHPLLLQRFSFIGQGSSLEASPPCCKCQSLCETELDTHTHSVPWSVLGTIMEKAARSFSQEAPAIAWGVSFGDVKLSQFPHCGLSCSRWRSVLLDYVDAGRQAGQA